MAKTYTPKLTERTEGIVSLVPKCGCVADIGCDHGYVSIALLQREIAEKAVACDIKEGPLKHAVSNIAKAGLEKSIDIRLAAGLEGLTPGEADACVIAGMGARTIMEILGNSPEIVEKTKYFILQPQSEIPEMRRYLRENGFTLLRNKMMREGEKYYFAMLVMPEKSDENGEIRDHETVAELMREGKIPGELTGLSHELDDLFGLDLLFSDREMSFYLTHVIRTWEETIGKLSEAAKPDYERINELEKKKVIAETALELNTLLCGIDERFKNLMEAEFIRRQEE